MASLIGNVIDLTSVPSAGRVELRPMSTPALSGGGSFVLSYPRVALPDSSGNIAFYGVQPGNYEVHFSSLDVVLIVVPTGSGTHDIADLLVDSLPSPDTAPNPGTFPTATDSVQGGVRVNTSAANPVVYRKEEVDDLLGAVAKFASDDFLADLATRTGMADKTVAVVAAGTALGDGGGGLFRWRAASTTTANGATVIIPDGQDSGVAGRWHRLFSF